eukprot:COSAG05_NODE_22509_length_264_cov_0.660606_1_plen_87_part_11
MGAWLGYLFKRSWCHDRWKTTKSWARLGKGTYCTSASIEHPSLMCPRRRTYGIVLKARQKETGAVVALKKFKVRPFDRGLKRVVVRV